MKNEDKIAELKHIIETKLTPLINGKYVLLDIPNHGNIGDNLIWEGEVNFLNKNISHPCLYSANVLNWDEDKIQNADVILFHGGGNWGDLYRICQDHRMYITKKYKSKRIVVFPQTAWYKNEDLLLNDCNIVNEHPNITVCLRDKQSYDLLSKYIKREKLLLIPDMAFCINLIKSNVQSNGTLFLKRTDSEQRENLSIPQNCTVSDWPTYPNNKYIYKLWHLGFVIKNSLSVKLQKYSITSWMVDPEYGLNYRNGRKKYIEKGIKLFSIYDKIYTTRLHGLILGILMGKDMYIIDNKYNKCKNFYNTWLSDFDHITIVSEELTMINNSN